ncbi:hypothetical protein ETB97_002153 [Aspergillus alliaceus]|uniref:Zn(2)-C6 fungal-type domain-containing protein n=1 Tax=Petromyces alliaceus TaxID=209559 RepID=A0A8H6A3I9_PETAA|nr:hypothetical protein ETB97_002153 [Aspergillus burnettii]
MGPNLPRPSIRESIDLLKSQQGCATCKIRKVKCDETRPQCLRCKTTGRKCPGPRVYKERPGGQPSYPVSQLHSLQPSSTTNCHGQRERRAFEYYFIHAASGIAGVLDISLWKGTIIQLCRSEPVVWDAVTALSALYENPDPFLGPPIVVPALKTVTKHHEALGWYFRSMKSMRIQIEQRKASIFTGLITCVLYLCIETLQGHTIEAFQLYEQGMRLLSALPPRNTFYENSAIQDLIVPLLFRLGVSAIVSAKYPVIDPFKLVSPTLDFPFPTIHSARTAVYFLAIESMSLLQCMGIGTLENLGRSSFLGCLWMLPPVVHEVVEVEPYDLGDKVVAGEGIVAKERHLYGIGVITTVNIDAIEEVYSDDYGVERVKLR